MDGDMRIMVAVFVICLLSSVACASDVNCELFCKDVMRDCVNLDVDSGMSAPDNPNVDLDHLRRADNIHRTQLRCFRIKTECINKCKDAGF